MATIKDLIEYLGTFPSDTEIVTTNSFAWWSAEVKEVTKENFGRYIHLKKNPQKDGREVKHPCLVIYDEKRTDY